MKRSILLTLCAFVVLSIWSQPICQVKEYSVNDGLGQSIVTGILQDRKGFLWLSTWNGLHKFDGYTFKNYKTSSQKEYSQTNNRITFTAETLDGNIWCQTYDSRAYIFDRQKELFFDVLKPIEDEIQRNNLVREIYTLDNGTSWIVCDEGYCFRVNELKYLEKEGIKLYNTFNGRLKGKQILNIYQDSDKDEWVLTDKGITIVGDKKINSDFPFKLIHEHHNKIYLVSTSEKLATYIPETESIRFIEIPYPVNTVYSIQTIEKDQLALATDHGIILFNTNDNTFKHVDIRTHTQPSNHALSLYKDKEREYWVFSVTPGVIRINLETGEKQHLFTPENEIVDHGRYSKSFLYEDNQGTLWVLPSKGNFSYYDRQKKQLRTFYTDPNNPNSAFTPLVRYYNADKQGNLWILSARGIKKMSFYPQNFNLKQIDEKGVEIRAFLHDNANRFWVACKSGYIRIYNPDGTLRGYLTPQGKITPGKVKFDVSVYCFHKDNDGSIWMGSKGHGLFQLREDMKDSFSIKNYSHNEENKYSLNSNDIYYIFTDSHSNTWIGTYGGGLNLIRKNAQGDIQFIHYKNELKNFPTEGFLNVRTITEATDSVILVGTTRGIISFSNHFNQPGEVKFYQNKYNTDDKPGMVGNNVMHIFTDSQGNTYVLTFTGGINKIVSKNLLSDYLEFKSYTTQNGLASDLVLSMIEDESGRLWVVSENGLSMFNPQNETFDNYDKTFRQYDFSFTEAIPTFNGMGQLVFGTDMGMLEIDPEKLKKSEYVPPIVFTDLRIQGKPSFEPIDDLKEISFTPSQRNITVYFSALDYIKPEEINYAYRLKGLEDQWNNSEKNRSASYINLPAGNYKLEVRSTNSDGVWVDNIRTLSIKILPTFWETGWAWLIYIIAFILFTGTIVYILFYIYRLRHQVDVEHQISDIKLRFFTDISHELRTPLTLITSPVTEVLENEPLSPTARKHLNLVHKNTERMLRLVNQILDFRKIQNRKMKILAEQTELVSFIEKISETFRLIAEEKQIDYSFETSVDELYVWIDRDKVEKIMFNLLSNAFKYTLNGKAIRIKLTVKDENVSISVEDEGIGIAPEKLGSLFKRFETLAKYNILQPSSGIGLSLVKELVEMHHGSIEVKSELEKGSTFCVTLPLNRAVLEKDDHIELIFADSPNGNDQKETTLPVITELEEATGEEEEEDQVTGELQTVLIVEDNVELKSLLKTILSGKYHIIEASNGEEGLHKVWETLPDMIISDVMMPVMDGLEMVKQIKSNKDICHIPIIILSSKSSLDDRIQGLENGIDDYITKPFSSSYLKARIASLFTQRKQLQEAFMNKLLENGSLDSTILEPSKPQIMPHDEMFIKQVMDFMEEQMDNPSLVIDDFASKLSLSRSIFYRKLKTITGLTPVDFIREIRFKRAIQLIENGSYNFSQIAYMTGFNDPKYFSKSFKKYMGVTPSEYKDRQGTGSKSI